MPPESVSRLALCRPGQRHGGGHLRDVFSPYLRTAKAQEPAPPADKDEREYLLWRIVQQEGSSPVGLALWMGWQMRMQPGEIAALTWDQVDFQNNLLRLREAGKLVRVGTRYYPAGAVVPPEEHMAAIRLICWRTAPAAAGTFWSCCMCPQSRGLRSFPGW